MSEGSDILRAIRDELRRLPDALVNRLRSSAAAGLSARQHLSSEPPPSRPRRDDQQQERPWYDSRGQQGSQIAAYENLGSALGRFVPALGELAGLSRSFREIMDAFARLDQRQEEATPRPGEEFRERAGKAYEEGLARPEEVPGPDVYGMKDQFVGPPEPTSGDRRGPADELPSAPPMVHYEVNEDWKPPEPPGEPGLPKGTTFDLAPPTPPGEPPASAAVPAPVPPSQPPEVYALAPPEAPRTQLEMPALEAPQTRLEPPAPPAPPTRYEPSAPETRLELPELPEPPRQPSAEEPGSEFAFPPWMRAPAGEEPPGPPAMPAEDMTEALGKAGSGSTPGGKDVATKLDELVGLTRQLLEQGRQTDSADADETERGENYKPRGLGEGGGVGSVARDVEKKVPNLEGPKSAERKGGGFIGSLVKEFIVKTLLKGV